MQRGAAHHLDVVVALADHAVGGLAHDRERLDQDVVERGAVGQPLTELGRLALQLVVGQASHVVAMGVDVGDDRLEGLDLLAFSRAEDAIENAHAAPSLSVAGTGWPQPRRPGPPAPLAC